MPNDPLDPADLLRFAAVADAGSFQAAADRLHAARAEVGGGADAQQAAWLVLRIAGNAAHVAQQLVQSARPRDDGGAGLGQRQRARVLRCSE